MSYFSHSSFLVNMDQLFIEERVFIVKIRYTFEQSGSLEVNRRRLYNRSAQSEENIAMVRTIVGEISKMSVCTRSQQVNIKRSSLCI